MYKILLIAFLFIFSAPILQAQVYLMCDTEFEYPKMAKVAGITGMSSSINFTVENGAAKILKVDSAQALLKEASIKHLSKLRFLKDSNDCRITFYYELRDNINRDFVEYLGDTIKIFGRSVLNRFSMHHLRYATLSPDTVLFHQELWVDFLILEKPVILLKIDSGNVISVLKNNCPLLKDEVLIENARNSIDRNQEVIKIVRTQNNGQMPSTQLLKFYLSTSIPECNYKKYFFEFK